MAELDYQRGLRGGSNLNYSGQQYDDWFAGYKEYDRIQKENDFKEQLESDKYYSPEDRAKRYEQRQTDRNFEILQIENRYRESLKRDKEAAYKSADSNRSLGMNLFFSVIGFVVVFIIGFVVVAILELFKIVIPIFVVWILAIIPSILVFSEGNNRFKKESAEAERRYGKRN